MRHHLSVDFLRSDPALDRRLAFPANIRFDWARWADEKKKLIESQQIKLNEAKSDRLDLKRWIDAGDLLVKEIEDYKPPLAAGPVTQASYFSFPFELEQRIYP